jgi:hypothetical protein
VFLAIVCLPQWDEVEKSIQAEDGEDETQKNTGDV